MANIAGIGVDIVEKARIALMYQRHPKGVLKRILSPNESLLLSKHANPVNFIAKRFAAKEALAKALGTGVRAPVLLPHMSIENDHLGKPMFVFTPELMAYLQTRNIGEVHLSISDERANAIAFVVLEFKENSQDE